MSYHPARSGSSLPRRAGSGSMRAQSAFARAVRPRPRTTLGYSAGAWDRPIAAPLSRLAPALRPAHKKFALRVPRLSSTRYPTGTSRTPRPGTGRHGLAARTITFAGRMCAGVPYCVGPFSLKTALVKRGSWFESHRRLEAVAGICRCAASLGSAPVSAGCYELFAAPVRGGSELGLIRRRHGGRPRSASRQGGGRCPWGPPSRAGTEKRSCRYERTSGGSVADAVVAVAPSLRLKRLF